MAELQSALYHAPGNNNAVALYNLRPVHDYPHAMITLAGLMNLFSSPAHIPTNLHVVIGINPALKKELGDPSLLPLSSEGYSMPDTQADVIVQVAAMTSSDVIYALRIVMGVLSESFICDEELIGAKLRFRQEPFGFYHGKNFNKEDIDQIAAIAEGDLAGGTWLLYQRYEQQLSPFFKLTENEQCNTMGAESVAGADTSFNAYPANAHTKVARAPGGKAVMVRRGFAYRKDGVEGTAFVAASKEVQHFSDTLHRMLAHDVMLSYTRAVEGGIYFAPCNGDWLVNNAGIPDVPDTTRTLLLYEQGTNKTPIPITDYTVVNAFVEYINLMRKHGLFEGKVGEMTFQPEVGKLLHAINAILAGAKVASPIKLEGGDPNTEKQLSILLADSLAGANRFNQVAKQYMTVG